LLPKLGSMAAVSRQMGIGYAKVRRWIKAVAPVDGHPTKTTVNRTLTVSETHVTESHPDAHVVGRKVTILVPNQKPITQILMTPEIAQAIWKSLTKEQRYDIFDLDSLWDNGYDDDMRMRTVEKVLVVYTDPFTENEDPLNKPR
jgi:hypothetical protein